MRHELMDGGGPVLAIDGDTARPVGAGDRVPCPDCDGAGTKMTPCWQGRIPCPTCDALGMVPAQYLVLRRFGERLWDEWRPWRCLSLEARRLGISSDALIDQELGRCCLRCDHGPEQCRCTETELEQAARAEGRLP